MNSCNEYEFQDIEIGPIRRLSFMPSLTPIRTICGLIKVLREGADLGPNRPVIITYHDMGMNACANFKSFFNHPNMRPIISKFSVIHINAPGQEEKAAKLPSNCVYPTLDQLADQIGAVCSYYEIRHFIGLGVGIGANILSRFALRYPDYVDGLFMINCSSTQASWSEWIYQKLNVHYLNQVNDKDAIPLSVVNYLLWHNYGYINEQSNSDLIFYYRQYFADKPMPPQNLAFFITSYINRCDLNIARDDENQSKSSSNSLQCPVVQLVGSWSAHGEDTIYMNTRLNPQQSTWMKLDDCGMPLEEKPDKSSEAFKLFIQGLGYTVSRMK